MEQVFSTEDGGSMFLRNVGMNLNGVTTQDQHPNLQMFQILVVSPVDGCISNHVFQIMNTFLCGDPFLRQLRLGIHVNLTDTC
jgi:hypothetical protein